MLPAHKSSAILPRRLVRTSLSFTMNALQEQEVLESHIPFPHSVRKEKCPQTTRSATSVEFD